MDCDKSQYFIFMFIIIVVYLSVYKRYSMNNRRKVSKAKLRRELAHTNKDFEDSQRAFDKINIILSTNWHDFKKLKRRIIKSQVKKSVFDKCQRAFVPWILLILCIIALIKKFFYF